MERHLLQGSSVMVDGRYVGTLRYLIEPGMAIVEIWVNEAASEELLVTIHQVSAPRNISSKGNGRQAGVPRAPCRLEHTSAQEEVFVKSGPLCYPRAKVEIHSPPFSPEVLTVLVK